MLFIPKETTSAPLVSVIVPIYNMEALLKRCVDSILNQSFSDLEIILVDDGSTDNSLQICYSYASAPKNIKVIKKENGGLSSARLAGFDAAKGKYILFVDSDDYIRGDMVQKLVDSIEENKSDLVVCGYYEKKNSNEKVILPLQHTDILRDRNSIIDTYIKPLIDGISAKSFIPGFIWIRLMKRALIQREFFQSERDFFMEDHVFNLLYADRVQVISIVHSPLYYYCVNHNSLTNRYRKNKWDMLLRLRDFYTEYLEERKIEGFNQCIEHFMLKAFCSCVDNAVLSGTYKNYKSELKRISKSGEISGIKLSIEGDVPRTYRITFFLFRSHFYLLLYCIRKNRLKQ